MVHATVSSRRAVADGGAAAWRGRRHWLSVVGVSGISGDSQAFRPGAVNAVADGERKRGSGYGLGLSTRTQVTGYQFLARRTAVALTRWRVRMEVEPGRRQALAVVASVSAALVICLGALLYSFISPSGQMNESPIIADRDTGALYVRVGNTLYPALNLASARLITGRADNPHKVRASQIAQQPHGPLVGIPGAPSQISPTSPTTSSWLVCDTVSAPSGAGAPASVTLTVIDGTPDLSGRRRVVTGSDAVVLRYENDTWVIRQGRRSRIDAVNRAVLLPLGLTPEQVNQARPMSRALFDAIPVGPELSVPEGAGRRNSGRLPGRPGPVGTVFTTPQISGPQQYSVVLSDGVQTVSAVVAQILQNAGNPGGGSTGGGVARGAGETPGGQRPGPVGLPGQPAEGHRHEGQPLYLLVVGQDQR